MSFNSPVQTTSGSETTTTPTSPPPPPPPPPPTTISSASVEFVGANDQYLSCGNIQFQRTDSFTISAWIYWNGEVNGGTGYVGIVGNEDGTLNNRGYSFEIEDAGGTDVLAFYLLHNGSNDYLYMPSTAPVPANQWVHVAVTYDGSSTTTGTHLYVDGVDVSNNALATSSLTNTTTNANPTVLGDIESPEAPHSGFMDEVSFWNAALTPAQISEIYGSGQPLDLVSHSAVSNLIHWYRMGEGDTAPTIQDNAGSNHCAMSGTGMGAANIVSGQTP